MLLPVPGVPLEPGNCFLKSLLLTPFPAPLLHFQGALLVQGKCCLKVYLRILPLPFLPLLLVPNSCCLKLLLLPLLLFVHLHRFLLDQTQRLVLLYPRTEIHLFMFHQIQLASIFYKQVCGYLLCHVLPQKPFKRSNARLLGHPKEGLYMSAEQKNSVCLCHQSYNRLIPF